MARGVFNCDGHGHVGTKPELKYLPDGTPVTEFNMAVTKSWTNKKTGELKTETTWVPLRAFGPTAEIICKYVEKGDLIGVESDYRTHTYVKDGVTKYSHRFVIDKFHFLESKKSENEELTKAVNQANESSDSNSNDQNNSDANEVLNNANGEGAQ